jgi:SulP family sulfate permease
VLTVVIDLTAAVVVGVLLAMFFFVKRMAEATQVERLDGASEVQLAPGAVVPDGIHVYEIRGPFFFGAATLLRDLDADFDDGYRALVLRLRHVPFVDATAAYHLRELASSCRKRGIRVILSECSARAQVDLDRHGIPEALGEGGIAPNLPAALLTGAKAMSMSGRRKVVQ